MKEKYIFLDRDGVICEDKHHIHKIEDIVLIPKSAEAIRLLNEHNYKVILITNQPVIARGLCRIDELKELNLYLERLLLKEGAKINKIYFCPHHPTAGNNSTYTRECECRKPKPGMILQAKKDFNIGDLSTYYMLGDKMSDIHAGKSAGCKTILVETGYGGKGGEQLEEIEPDYYATNLYNAVKEIILKEGN